MLQVNGNGYKLLGFAVWRGAKWYARRKLRPHRARAATAAGALVGLGALALIARRAAS
jgi:hypothetical protein